MNHKEFSSRGGKARAKKLTPEERQRIARKGAKAMHKRKRSERPSTKSKAQDGDSLGASAGYPARKPAEVWPVGHFIENEMRERGWTRRELVKRVGCGMVNQLAINILIDAPQKGVRIGNDLAADIARAFGTSAELWLNLDKAWQDNARLCDGAK
jgi:plasmid maintenance system antidote protein VapI